MLSVCVCVCVWSCCCPNRLLALQILTLEASGEHDQTITMLSVFETRLYVLLKGPAQTIINVCGMISHDVHHPVLAGKVV